MSHQYLLHDPAMNMQRCLWSLASFVLIAELARAQLTPGCAFRAIDTAAHLRRWLGRLVPRIYDPVGKRTLGTTSQIARMTLFCPRNLAAHLALQARYSRLPSNCDWALGLSHVASRPDPSSHQARAWTRSALAFRVSHSPSSHLCVGRLDVTD